MARLVYSALCSLDGYTVDAQGRFDWCRPDEQVHAFVNDLERPIGTYLYGRRMYEVMSFWDDPEPDDDPVFNDYVQIWQAADKVVYSTTLAVATTARTRIERDLGGVRALLDEADKPVAVGGPHLAGQLIQNGLVDEISLFRFPVVVGSGTRALPDHRLALELLESRVFDSGVTYARYRVTG